MSELSLSPSMIALFSEIRRAASSASTIESLPQTVVAVLSRDLAHYSWTGFYMLDSSDADTLILGPFVGAQRFTSTYR
jgi:L-methionine (R)-S-oxide reductase